MTTDHTGSEFPLKLPRLFRPGPGDIPPVLAGREAPLDVLNLFLADLTEGRNPPREAVLYGPRGNGKTVLLTVFRNICRAAGIDVVSLTPDRLKNSADLAAMLLYNNPAEVDNLLKQVRPDTLKIKIPILGEAGWQSLSPADRDNYQIRHLEGLLVARCQHKPLVVTLDEAHTLDIETGRRLLNLSQSVRGEGAPFLLVLAGTPNLRDHLNRMSATFWTRAEILGIGRLSEAATEEALVKPLSGFGIEIDKDALATVIKDSQCYPYFIQTCGEALCHAMAEAGIFHADMRMVDAAMPQFEARKTWYYGDRYQEMDGQGLLVAAEAVAEVFAERETVRQHQLRKCLTDATDANEETARKQLDCLLDLGYIWQPDGNQFCEPGIPSLMNHVLQERRLEADAG